MPQYNMFDLPNLNGSAAFNPNSIDWTQYLGQGGFGGMSDGQMANGWNGSMPGQQQLGFGWNMPTLQLGVQGLGTLGNLWGAWQGQKLAKDQLNFTKKYAQANLANQTKSYNTALSDRATSRGVMEGWTPAQTQGYIDKNKLTGT